MLINMLADRFDAGGVLRARGTQVDVSNDLALRWIGDGVATAVGNAREAAQGMRREVEVMQDLVSGQQLAAGAPVSEDGNLARLLALQAGKPRFRWVAGDHTTGASVAVGTPVTTYADDLQGLSDGTVVFVTTGGTLAIEAQASDDGVAWSSIGVLGSALAAGSYAYRLDTMPRARFVRYILTASGSTCTVRAYSMWTTAHTRMPTRQVRRGVIGDGSVNVALSASGTLTSPPIDLRFAVRSQSSVRIVVASGTVKVSGQLSRDGRTDLLPLGDIATGLTAGTHTIQLGSLAQYGHFLTLTVTETAAAAASVQATASLALADAFASTPGRKVAVVAPRQGFEGANWTNNYNGATMSIYSMLERMGYDVELLPLDDGSTIFDDGALRYEFAVMPFTTHGGLWTTWTSGAGKPVSRLCKGETAIPFFAVGVSSSNNAVLAANIGAGVCDAATSRKLNWRGAIWYQPLVSAYTVQQQPHMSQYAVWQTDSGGGTTGWLFKGNRGWVYVSSGFNHPGDSNALPFMLAEAIMRGHIASPPRKLTAVVDVDDMPACDGGATGTMTLADLDRVYVAMQAMQMPNSFGIRPEDITGGRQSLALSQWVAARTADRGGLLYPIVHNGNWFWKDGTKAVKDAAYRADIATVTGAGIRVGTDDAQQNAWGYIYANNNAWDEESLQLGQPGADYTASVDGFSVRSGFGWRVCRLDNLGGNNSESIGEPAEVHAQTWYRGTRLVASHVHIGAATKALSFDDAGAGQAAIALQCGRLVRYTYCYGMPFYIHGQNCFDAHDGGDAPGTRWLELLAGMYSAGLSNVVQYVHGASLADE